MQKSLSDNFGAMVTDEFTILKNSHSSYMQDFQKILDNIKSDMETMKSSLSTSLTNAKEANASFLEKREATEERNANLCSQIKNIQSTLDLIQNKHSNDLNIIMDWMKKFEKTDGCPTDNESGESDSEDDDLAASQATVPGVP